MVSRIFRSLLSLSTWRVTSMAIGLGLGHHQDAVEAGRHPLAEYLGTCLGIDFGDVVALRVGRKRR